MPLSYWKKVHKQTSSRQLGRQSKSLAAISRNPYNNNKNDEEMTPLRGTTSSSSSYQKIAQKRSHSFGDLAVLGDNNDNDNTHVDETNVKEAAEVMTQTLLEMNTDDEELNYQVLRASLNLNYHTEISSMIKPELMRRVHSVSYADLSSIDMDDVHKSIRGMDGGGVGDNNSNQFNKQFEEKSVGSKIGAMVLVVVIVLFGVFVLLFVGEMAVGPPRQPVGPYKLVGLHEGNALFDAFTFYEGADSAGSNGYNTYVSRRRAFETGIASITTESVTTNGTSSQDDTFRTTQSTEDTPKETFVYMSSNPTEKGPRESIRLEGNRRFERGLFILDVRHMPSGCGTWPAFWLTDEPNWPVNGEIDILEGVNYQTEAKTALHSTRTCVMDDVPEGVKTGYWDTAIGVPNAKTGIPDMTVRYATDCYVYNQHQWLNQGCVSISDQAGSIGEPFNEKGGGVYALEWDPVNRHIRSWVFFHKEIPDNLQLSLDTAHDNPEERINPDPNEWGLPFGYFAIGDSTSCQSSHFKNMRLVFNLAFCGSVSGNRYFMDCPKEFKEYKTCNQYIASNPDALKEAYWKIKGLYIFEREWQNSWV